MYQFIDLRQNGRTKPTDKNYRMNKTMFQFELSGPIPDKLSSTNHTAHWRPTRIWQWHNSIDFSCILHRKISSDSSGTHFPLISVRIMIDYPLPPSPQPAIVDPLRPPSIPPFQGHFSYFKSSKGLRVLICRGHSFLCPTHLNPISGQNPLHTNPLWRVSVSDVRVPTEDRVESVWRALPENFLSN